MSVLGVDVGTSRVKAVRFDRDWRAVDSEAVDTTVTTTPDGRSEQDMDQVCAAVVGVLAAVASLSPDEVELVALTAQGDGCWLVDRDGRPVGPALLWNDGRSAPLISRWQADGTLQQVFDVCGSLGAAGLAHAQLRWLADEQPERAIRHRKARSSLGTPGHGVISWCNGVRSRTVARERAGVPPASQESFPCVSSPWRSPQHSPPRPPRASRVRSQPRRRRRPPAAALRQGQ